VNYTSGTSVKTTISFVRKGVTNEKTWSTEINSKEKTDTPDTDALRFPLKKGTTRFILKQVRNDSNDTSACYDDFKLEFVEPLKPSEGTVIFIH